MRCGRGLTTIGCQYQRDGIGDRIRSCYMVIERIVRQRIAVAHQASRQVETGNRHSAVLRRNRHADVRQRTVGDDIHAADRQILDAIASEDVERARLRQRAREGR